MSKITVEMSGDEAKLFRSYERIIQQQVKMEKGQKKLGRTAAETGRKMERAGQKAARAGGKAGDAFGTMALARLTTYAGGVMGIRKAFDLVATSIKDLEEQRRRSFDANRSLQQMQSGAINMLGDVGGEQVEKFTQRVDKMVAEVKPIGGKKTAYQVLGTALSAAGDQDLAFKATRLGLRLGRQSAEEATAIAGGLLDISQVTGERDDMLKNAGFLLASTTQARVISLAGMAKYGAPAVLSISKTGGTAGESMALFTSLTKALADPEGRRAGTAAVTLAMKMAEFLPMERDTARLEAEKKGKFLGGRLPIGLTSPDQRMRYLWENPEARKLFEAEYVNKMGVKSIGGVKSLLEGPQGLAGQQYLKALAEIPTVAEAAPYATRKIAALEYPFPAKMAAGEQSGQTTKERYAATEGGMIAAAEHLYSAEKLDELLSDTGFSWGERFSKVTMKYRGSWDQDNREAFEEIVKQIALNLQSPKAWREYAGAPSDSDNYYYRNIPKAQREERAQILLDHLGELRKQTEILRAQDRQKNNPTLGARPDNDKPRNG